MTGVNRGARPSYGQDFPLAAARHRAPEIPAARPAVGAASTRRAAARSAACRSDRRHEISSPARDVFAGARVGAAGTRSVRPIGSANYHVDALGPVRQRCTDGAVPGCPLNPQPGTRVASANFPQSDRRFAQNAVMTMQRPCPPPRTGPLCGWPPSPLIPERQPLDREKYPSWNFSPSRNPVLILRPSRPSPRFRGDGSPQVARGTSRGASLERLQTRDGMRWLRCGT